MARIIYDDTTIGGKLTAELINDAIALKDKAERLMAMVNANTAGGATGALIAVGGANAAMFNVASGAGSTFYAALHDSVYLPIVALTDANLADLDMGG